MRHSIRVGAALLILGLAACGDVVARPNPTPTPIPPPPTARSIVTVSALPARPTAPGAIDATAAAAVVRARVTGIPRLLPAAVPDGMQAIVTAEPDSYMVEYTDDTHVRTITIMSNAGLGVNGPHQTLRTIPFRGVTANYFTDDTTDPTSKRRLYWREQAAALVYELIASGFTEAEFLQIANSLQQV